MHLFHSNSATMPLCSTLFLCPRRYELDLELAAKMGANSFRFSFEWHRIEPEQGTIDYEAIMR